MRNHLLNGGVHIFGEKPATPPPDNLDPARMGIILSMVACMPDDFWEKFRTAAQKTLLTFAGSQNEELARRTMSLLAAIGDWRIRQNEKAE